LVGIEDSLGLRMKEVEESHQSIPGRRMSTTNRGGGGVRKDRDRRRVSAKAY